MKKIISILSCFCYLNVSLGALPELSWVCDHSDNMNLTVVAKDTGNPVVESEVIELAGIDPARAIPTSKHEYDILVNEYLSTSSDSLNYSSTFWDIIKRSEIDLKFSVITEEQTQKWLANVCIFMNWVINDSHRFFVSKMVTKFFNAWDSSLKDIQKTALIAGLQAEQLHINLLKSTLNDLLSIVNARKQYIRWTF